MKIPCNRCGKQIERANKKNAKYITELCIDKDKTLTRRNIIICLKCLKKDDEVIW